MAADDDNGDGTGLFDVCAASPLKNNDEGSLDIYAGLDSAVSDSTARSCVSFRNCLDLYEDFLTEEGTAKEATYNDLQVEYGKCQRQMKELMERFKEIQTQNLNLKNENQSLKKNISALIKTARVEINRKDEEINHLHQRLSEFPHFRNNHKTSRIKDTRPKSPHLDECAKTDHGVKSDIHKDVHPNPLQPNLEKEGKSHSEGQNPLHLPMGIEKHCTNSVWSRSHYQVGDGNSSEDNRRGRNDIRHSQCSRGTDRTQKDLNNSGSDGEPRDKEVNSRLQGNPEKRGSGDARAESKSSEIKSSTGLGYKSERSASSWEKESSRERPHKSQNDKNLERQNERLQNVHRKDLQCQDKAERKGDVKFKPAGEDHGHRGRVERELPSHSKNDVKYYGFGKCHPEDRRGREDCKRDRGVSSHGFQHRRCSSSLSSNRNSKHLHSKEVSVAHQWENTPSKAERHRTEDRRKRERENKEESRQVRSDKKSPTEYLQRTNKDIKKSIADVKRQTEPKNGKGGVSNNEVSKGADTRECAVKVKNGPNEVKSKDLKLSFMEKLNLTLSPAKKQPVCQDSQHQITSVPKPSGTCDYQSAEKPGTVACLPSVCGQSTEESKSGLSEPKEALPAASQLRASVPENKMKPDNTSLDTSVENTVPCEMLVCGTEISFPAPTEIKQKMFPSAEVEGTHDDSKAAASVVMDVSPDHVPQDFGKELATKRNDDSNSCDISEGVKTKAVLSPKAAVASESLLKPLVEEPGISLVNCLGDKNPKLEPCLEDRPMVENKSCPLKPCLPKEPFISSPQKTELIDHKIETGESNSVYQDDDNSVLSIDFNNLRPIPAAISPLSSPVRPVAKVLSMESPCVIPAYDSSHKDEFPSNSTHSTFKAQSDLNKENQKPDPKFDRCSEAESCKSLSLDELEEGEVRSEDEESAMQRHLEKSGKPRASAEVQLAISSPGDRSTAHVQKDHRSTGVKPPQDSITLSKRPNESRPSSSKRESKMMSISSLEKILPLILAPSSIWEVMHMFRMLGKHVRKNYMKFKVKFSLVQFHRIIESAILSFTSLIKYLDLSKICKSVSTLQKSLCEVIESNLKQVKKNGIVDRLFEQQQTDMKKKLWKFVDEQLDYLFEKLKKLLLKFCGSVNFGNDKSEEKVGKKHKERTQHSNGQKRNMDNNKEIRGERVLKSENTVNFKSSSGYVKFEEKHQDQNNTSPSTIKHDVKRSVSTCPDNTKNSECKEQFLQMNYPSTPKPRKNEESAREEAHALQHASTKSERGFEILTEQQASSLTFNLVSDAQMGEIFKSLLQGSDLLDTSVNGTEKTEWELKTPEKQLLESLKCESAPACTTEELVSEGASLCPKVVSDDNWSLLSSEKGPSLSSGLSLPVHPDVLDESCMFEVSSNIALSKDSVCNSEKSKPCISSILLEDLAVSLTVPSPLKSDGHLSFLKPEVLSTSTPEEVISAHFSEDALLEEEDASEQDIHLALESDNSSSKSSCSSWTSRSVAPGFQYHPNLPMHAVIMEKSNDHFIVKIRRAAPSTSPGILKHSMVAEEAVPSLPRTGKEADVATEKESVPFQSPVLNSVEDLDNSEKDVDNSKPGHEEQNCIVQTQVPDIYEFLEDASSKVGHCDQVVDDCFKLHQVWESKVSENLQELPSVKKIPHSVDDHLPSAHIDLTKDPATETKSLGELMEVTVLNIDHLECSRTNSDQDGQTIGSSLQPNSFIDLTHDGSSKSKSEPVLAVEGLECQVICIDEDSHKEGKMGGVNGPLEKTVLVEDTCIDLTPESPGSCEIKRQGLKSEPLSNLDCLELPGTLGNVHKKRKNSPGLNHSSQKKQRKDTDLTSSEKTKRLSQNSDRNGTTHRKQASRKREPTANDTSASLEASPGVKDSAAALATFPTSLSAKNVIKKKGEIIVSWTRNDDREILLECQRRMPSLKTFTYLAVKLNKNPNQVSERFQQLKKLFEKSTCR